MCGVAFREDRAQPACVSCPLTRMCHHVRCPHCGYENPALPGWLDGDRSAAAAPGERPGLGRLLGWLRGLLGSGRDGASPARDAEVLADLSAGCGASVEGLVDPSSGAGRALAGLGVLPGAEVVVLQTYPAWIVRIDYAEIALDDSLARQVRIGDVRR